MLTKSSSQTKKLGEKTALNRKASVFALIGDLGSGKTTFAQGFAKGLGIKDKILSPTFVIMKKYDHFYHIDCYRIENKKELLDLGFKEIISNPKNVVIIEWAEKIKSILPKDTVFIEFKFVNMNTREISWKN